MDGIKISCHYDVFCMFLHRVPAGWNYIFVQESRILCEYSDAIFTSPARLVAEICTSPASLVSEIDAFVSCHYDVFCMFLHDILIDSSIFHWVPVGFKNYTTNFEV